MNKKKSFTLIELLVVLAIIGIFSFTLTTQDTSGQSKIKSKSNAYILYSFISRHTQKSFTEREDISINLTANVITSTMEDTSTDSITLSDNFTYIINDSDFIISKNKNFDKDITITVRDSSGQDLQQIQLYSTTGFAERSHRNFENTGWVSE